MSRQLIHQLPTPHLPNTHTPIPAPHPHPLPLAIPTRPHQIPLHPHRRPCIRLHTPIARGERSDIPRPRVPIMRIAEQTLRIRGDFQRRYRVRVTGHRIRDRLLPDIPHLDILIDAPSVNFVSGFRDRDSRDWELRFYKVHRAFYPRIPDTHAAVVGRGQENLFPARGGGEVVYDFRVPLVSPDAGAGLQVPGAEGRVCGGGEDVVRGARPVEGENGGFVAG